MLYVDDTLDEEDVLMIVDELEEVQNSPLQISLSWRRFFLKISLSTSGRQRVSRLRYMSRTTTHVDCVQANELVLFVLVLGSKALC